MKFLQISGKCSNFKVAAGFTLFVFMILLMITSFTGPALAAAAYTISDTPITGGDCSTIGTWDSFTKTCTLTVSLGVIGDGIEIIDDGITLDGAGFTLAGNNTLGSRGVRVDFRSGVTVKNLVVEQFEKGISLGSSSGNTISGNTARSNSTGIRLDGSTGNTIANNNTTNNTYGMGLESASNGNTVSSNQITNQTLGLRVGFSDYNNITDNTVSSHGASGIFIYYADNNTITTNVTDTNSTGILLQHSNGNTIDDNLSKNNYNGISMMYSSSGNTAQGNIVRLNTVYGISLYNSADGNTFTENTIESSPYGARVQNSSSNTYYRNEFIGNTTQALVIGGSGNVFNLPIPDGGNHWSDFDEVGEGCADTNSDGICDSPYIFSGGQDDYPWTTPGGWCTKPSMTLYNTNVYWATLMDYQSGLLSIDYLLDNYGAVTAIDAKITGSTSTNGVTLATLLPMGLGNVNGYGFVSFTLLYSVPNNITSFTTVTWAEAKDACGNLYYYP